MRVPRLEAAGGTLSRRVIQLLTNSSARVPRRGTTPEVKCPGCLEVGDSSERLDSNPPAAATQLEEGHVRQIVPHGAGSHVPGGFLH